MIELPDDLVPNLSAPRYRDFGGFLTPPLGGKVLRLDRMGNRFKLALSFPPLPAHAMGRIAVSRLIRGKTEGIRTEFLLPGFAIGAPGAPVVDGDGQAGRSLSVRGFTPNYVVREGQWFTHVHAGGMCLYNADAQSAADASGDCTVAFSPMLRVEPMDGDALLFGRPMIEGYVQGEEWGWEHSLAHHTMIEFEIEEME